MITNLTEPSLEPRIIHADEDCYDAMYWSIKFGVSMERLFHAVHEVGPRAIDVERHLNRSTLKAHPSQLPAAISLQDWRLRTGGFR